MMARPISINMFLSHKLFFVQFTFSLSLAFTQIPLGFAVVTDEKVSSETDAKLVSEKSINAADEYKNKKKLLAFLNKRPMNLLRSAVCAVEL